MIPRSTSTNVGFSRPGSVSNLSYSEGFPNLNPLDSGSLQDIERRYGASVTQGINMVWNGPYRTWPYRVLCTIPGRVNWVRGELRTTHDSPTEDKVRNCSLGQVPKHNDCRPFDSRPHRLYPTLWGSSFLLFVESQRQPTSPVSTFILSTSLRTGFVMSLSVYVPCPEILTDSSGKS